MPFLRGALFALLALGCRALETKEQTNLGVDCTSFNEPFDEPACIAATGCVVTKTMDGCQPE